MFILGYDDRNMDAATLKASFNRISLVHKQRLHEINRLRK